MDQYSKVSVFAPARLHMGFIDLSGSLDRHFGSIGIALNEHATRLSLTSGEKRVITGPSAERADKCLTYWAGFRYANVAGNRLST
jgi:predicted sugar kinase